MDRVVGGFIPGGQVDRHVATPIWGNINRVVRELWGRTPLMHGAWSSLVAVG
jgi:hypothetical protein